MKYRLTSALRVAVIIMGASFVASMPSSAQMREGLPPVLTPSPPPEVPDQMYVVHEFHKENKRVKRPRFILFWNREFSDEVVTYYIDYQVRAAQASSGHLHAYGRESDNVYGNTWTGAAASEHASQSAHVSASSAQATSGRASGIVQMNKDEARKNLDEIVNMKLESSFKNMFIKGGARLINREMVIRTEGKGAAGDEKINTHALETNAMIGKADYLVEIILVPSAESLTGLAFQSNVVAIDTGEMIASIYTDAMPPTVERTTYEATSDGFRPVTELDGYSDQNVGRQLAIDTMRELTDYWRMMASMEE